MEVMMKKCIFVIVLSVFLLNSFIAHAQTCDCEALQIQIEDLNHQINILKGNDKQLENSDQTIKIGNFNISINDIAVVEDRNGFRLLIELLFFNNSNDSISFDKAIGYRFYINGIELRPEGIRGNDIHLRPGNYYAIHFYYILPIDSGFIELDAWPLDDENNIYSGVIYNLDQKEDS